MRCATILLAKSPSGASLQLARINCPVRSTWNVGWSRGLEASLLVGDDAMNLISPRHVSRFVSLGLCPVWVIRAPFLELIPLIVSFLELIVSFACQGKRTPWFDDARLSASSSSSVHSTHSGFVRNRARFARERLIFFDASLVCSAPEKSSVLVSSSFLLVDTFLCKPPKNSRIRGTRTNQQTCVSYSSMPLWFRAEFFMGAGAAVRNPKFFRLSDTILIGRNPPRRGGILWWVVSKPRTQRKRTPLEEQPPKLINFGGCSSCGVLFLQVLDLETTQQRNPPGGVRRFFCKTVFPRGLQRFLRACNH